MHALSDVAGISYGSAVLYVSPDDTIPFRDRAMAIARPTVVNFWDFGFTYTGVQRYAIYLMLLWAVWTAWLTGRRVRIWQNAKIGKCAKCGYDLRASKECCPECGTLARERPLSTRVLDACFAAATNGIRDVTEYVRQF